jgi:large repetitive protein
MTKTSRSLPRRRSWKAGLGSIALLGTALAALALVGATAAGATTATVPGSPTITSVSAGDHSIRVSFTRPATDGGAHISLYKATCTSSDGGVTRSESDGHSSIRVSHVTPAKTYTCTVAARNRVGFGLASAPSASVIPLPNPVPTVPGAPTITSVTPGVRSITVAFSPPGSDGAAHIFQYKATCVSSDGGVTRSNERGGSPIRVGDLTSPKTYTCTVTARNKKGKGPASAPSAAVVTLLPIVANSPGAPAITSAVPGKHSVTLTYTAPASDGGSPIIEYRSTCISTNGGVTRAEHERTSPTKVDGLTAARTYTCTVAARNKRGYGPESAPSGAVTVLS